MLTSTQRVAAEPTEEKSTETQAQKIARLNKALTFDLHNLHKIGNSIRPAVTEAAELIDQLQKPYPIETLKLISSVCKFYLSHARDKDLSLKYLGITEDYVKAAYEEKSFGRAMYILYTAYARTIDGGYGKKEGDELPFTQTLNILAELPQDSDVLKAQAFAKRYLSLMSHRKSFNDKLSFGERESFSREAQRIVTEAAAIQLAQKKNEEDLKIKPTIILLDLAETTHIQGVIEAEMSKILKEQGREEEASNKLLAAQQKLEEAAKYWLAFCEATQTDPKLGHAIMFITEQSLGDISTRLGNPDKGLEHLNRALQGHIQCYDLKTPYIHLDIAKTYHFLGNAYAAKNDHKAALENFTQASIVKREAKATPFMQQVSQEEMLNTLGKLPRFEWNEYKTINDYKKNLATVEAALNEFSECAAKKNLKLNSQQELTLARHYFELGSYYNHVSRDADKTDKSGKYLAQAKEVYVRLKNNSDELAWVENHLAFTQQQLLAATKNKNKALKAATLEYRGISANDPYRDEKLADCLSRNPGLQNYMSALDSCKQIRGTYTASSNPAEVKINAFALCIQALTEYEDGQLETAIATYRQAMNLYKRIGGQDDQYARAKNRWAMMLVENGQLQEASQAFTQLETYWNTYKDDSNPYPARFYEVYGDFLQKNMKDLPLAVEKFTSAYKILLQTEGAESKFTKGMDERVAALKVTIQASNVPVVTSSSFYQPAPLTTASSPSKTETAEQKMQMRK